MNRSVISLTLAGLVSLYAAPSFAQGNSIGAGIGRSVEFSGSDDYQVTPIAAFDIDTPLGRLKNNQIGAQLTITKHSVIETGPVVRFNAGRDNSVTDSVIASLPEISSTAELGWFIGSGFKVEKIGINSNAIVIGELSAVTDAGDGHGGVQINGSLGLVIPINDKLRLVPSISFNYTDDEYTSSFYGVSTAAANASGLAEYSAAGGVEFTQLSVFAVRTINQQWFLSGAVALTTLQGDAADSPITARGSDNHVFTGVVLNYNF